MSGLSNYLCAILLIMLHVQGTIFSLDVHYDNVFVGQQGELASSEILRIPAVHHKNGSQIRLSSGFESYTIHEDVPFYPLADITGTSIGLIHGHPTLCGGYYRYDENNQMGYIASNECWSYAMDNDSWVSAPDMTEERQYAASVTINGSYFILGGKNSDYVPISSIEKFDGKKWNQIGGMPWGVSSHCVTPINSSHVLVTGGDYLQEAHPMDPPSHCSNVSYILNIKDFSWKKVESFAKHLTNHWEIKCGHGCSKMPGGNSKIVLVGAAVNTDTDEIYNIVETFDPVSEQWMAGPKFPFPINGAALVNKSNSILMIGGISLNNGEALNTIYELHQNNSWTLLEDKLKYARYGFSAISFG